MRLSNGCDRSPLLHVLTAFILDTIPRASPLTVSVSIVHVQYDVAVL
jgi:hypothetical protein